MKRITTSLLGLGLAATGVLAVQPPASANVCGPAQGCTGSWTRGEYDALDGNWRKVTVEQLCLCEGMVEESWTGHRSYIYNNAQYSNGWVEIYYNMWADGYWHASAKAWAGNTGGANKVQL